jgi:hypothetical protein
MTSKGYYSCMSHGFILVARVRTTVEDGSSIRPQISLPFAFLFILLFIYLFI